ncbi:MAG: type VI secretion system tip protein TssI/VgrG [bacterium]
MVEYRHNEPYYKLEFIELEEDVLKILSFQGEEQISGLFEYRFELLSDQPDIDASQILNKKATFIITRGEEDPLKIHGIISHFEQRGRTPDYVSYFAVLVPKMWRLKLTYQNEIYKNMNMEQLVGEVLKNSGFGNEDYRFDLTESYPENEYIVQYQETNFNFISRKLEADGIFYFIEHQEDNDVIVFTDSNDKIQKINQQEDIFYNPNKDPLSEKETISELTYQEKVVTGLVRLKDYNYLYPEKQLMAESQINSDHPGIYYHFGDGFNDETQAAFYARVRNQEILAECKTFKGKSDCRLFRAGFSFTMGRHYRDDWNSEYILTKVFSRGIQYGLFGILPPSSKIHPTFENYFEAIPVDVDYRPPRVTPTPQVYGIMSAKVESGSNDEYGFIDDHGRYKAKMHFDLSDRSNGEATLPIRMSQPYSGTSYGIHFPNHAGTELVWSCLDGNIDRPVGLGTIPNPSQPSPVTSQNRTQNLIRTASGNEILMDDVTGSCNIALSTPDANRVLLDDKDDKIDIVSKDKYQVTLDDKNENITVKSKNGHVLILDDKNTKITCQSKDGHMISIDDGNSNITLIDSGGGNKIVIDISAGKIVINSDDGNIDLHAPNGKIDILAKELNVETSGDTKMKSANMTTEVTSDLKMTATNITEEASMDMKTRGMNVQCKGDMEVKLEAGLTMGVKGTMTSVEGSMTAELKGGAKTAITGGIVMIN